MHVIRHWNPGNGDMIADSRRLEIARPDSFRSNKRRLKRIVHEKFLSYERVSCMGVSDDERQSCMIEVR